MDLANHPGFPGPKKINPFFWEISVIVLLKCVCHFIHSVLMGDDVLAMKKV